jgi:hypothetical protein
MLRKVRRAYFSPSRITVEYPGLARCLAPVSGGGASFRKRQHEIAHLKPCDRNCSISHWNDEFLSLAQKVHYRGLAVVSWSFGQADYAEDFAQRLSTSPPPSEPLCFFCLTARLEFFFGSSLRTPGLRPVLAVRTASDTIDAPDLGAGSQAGGGLVP